MRARTGALAFTFVVAMASSQSGFSGDVMSWGSDQFGQVTVPSGLSNVVQVAAGAAHSLALKRDGTLAIWGKIYNGSNYGAATLPAGLTNIVSISAGFYHSLALRADGRVIGWGYDAFGAASGGSQLSNIIAISANADQSLALTASGTVKAWGRGSAGSSQVPNWLTNVVTIAAGQVHNLALRRDGTVVGWGANYWGQATGTPTPVDATHTYGSTTGLVTIAGKVLTKVIAVSGGGTHSLALKADGTVVAWGKYDNGLAPETDAQAPPGLSNVVAVAAGFDFDLALKSDGRPVAWGYNPQGEATVPAGLGNISAIAAGFHHSLAVRTLFPPPVAIQGLEMFAGLMITGAVSQRFTIEWTDELNRQTNWRTLTNFALPASPYLFLAPIEHGAPAKFYRVAVPFL